MCVGEQEGVDRLDGKGTFSENKQNSVLRVKKTGLFALYLHQCA
jgi:hypothetical protein